MAKQETGFVYIMINPSFRENWIKIGCTAKLPEERSNELFNTALPLPFKVYGSLETHRYKEAEKLAHQCFIQYRINENREFFLVDPEKAMDLFKGVAELMKEGTKVHKYKEDGTVESTTYGESVPKVKSSSHSPKSETSKIETNTTKDPESESLPCPSELHLFHVQSKDMKIKASGYYDENTHKFVVLKGSIIASNTNECFKNHKQRAEALKQCVKKKGFYCLKKDYSFDSPSTAVCVVLGTSENGYRRWKDDDHKKLAEIYPLQ